jgi:GTP cyclohydrolase II
MINQLAARPLRTTFGTFTEYMYSNEAIALVMGDVEGVDDVLCRIHSSCLSGHAFNSVECQCREEMEISQEIIQKAGRGVVIWLEQEGRGNGHLAVMKSTELKKQGMGQTEAYISLGYSADSRSIEAAADALKALGVGSIRLLSESTTKADALRKCGIKISGLKRLERNAV